MKHMFNVHAFMGLNEALDMEVEQQTMMAKTDDFIEGVSAFIEKRKPVYQGKWLSSKRVDLTAKFIHNQITRYL